MDYHPIQCPFSATIFFVLHSHKFEICTADRFQVMKEVSSRANLQVPLSLLASETVTSVLAQVRGDLLAARAL